MNAYLQPSENVIETVRVKLDVRTIASSAEHAAPWANLTKSAHDGTLILTGDRLLAIFDPGNERVLSVPIGNVLMAWERAAKGKKAYPPQFVFTLPAGMFMVCELESIDQGTIDRLRRIVHLLVRVNSRAAGSDAAMKHLLSTDVEAVTMMLAI